MLFVKTIFRVMAAALSLLALVQIPLELRKSATPLSDDYLSDYSITVPQYLASMDEPFSACMMVMDENYFLVEWLAYHYHVLPLRRLILYSDPRAKTTPQSILDRWKGKINITVFEESDVFPNGMAPVKGHLKEYLFRHREFLGKCLKTLKDEGRGWTLITEADEYVLINDGARNPSHPMSQLKSKNLTIPDQEDPGSVLTMLRRSLPHTASSKYFFYQPCVPLSRKHFGIKEDPNATKFMDGILNSTDDSTMQDTLLWFNASHFQTLHWRYFAKKRNIVMVGKTMIDLSRVDMSLIRRHSRVHHLIRDICTDGHGKWVGDHENFFVANHYPGTWDQVMFRMATSADKDAPTETTKGPSFRRQRYQENKKHSTFHDEDVIQTWFKGFVSNVGASEAKRLLEGVGETESTALYVAP